MDARIKTRTKIESRLPSRPMTAAPSRARYLHAMGLTASGSTDAAPQLPAIVHEGADIAGIFKKTLCVADLKPRGRYVAKDKFESGGIIEIHADVAALNVKLTGPELAERKTRSKPRETNHRSGALWNYGQQVGPAVDGAITHLGGAYEKQCYADI